MRPKPGTLPIVCSSCRRVFTPTIEQLKTGTNKCPLCGHQIKATPEFVAAMRADEDK